MSISVYFRITFDVLSLALKAVQREDDAAYQHIRVHQRAVDLRQKGLKLQVETPGEDFIRVGH